jgi:hypothetical protein
MGTALNTRWRNLYRKDRRVIGRRWVRRDGYRYEVTTIARGKQRFLEVWLSVGEGIWERLATLEVPGTITRDRRIASWAVAVVSQGG